MTASGPDAAVASSSKNDGLTACTVTWTHSIGGSHGLTQVSRTLSNARSPRTNAA